ncbi:DUF5983 family protein [Xanthomonas euvesicatoria]|uniref:DUF5983 family protein n=1 Tax=Xanthomonas euvesicatoria TaxID=456327 RepID=UPI001C456682|nr:ABC transporter substrate-binding protein [Xanthomonas euvesicatoria]MBV6791570.1 ABC transporter substrate-binding protein [Xanthomonas campestris pv. clerodendri]
MSNTENPFVRGYSNLRIVRTLCISYEDGSPMVWRPIHASQAHLSDRDLISSPCIVTNDFAVIRDIGGDISDELATECDAGEGVSGEGVVGAVVHAIHGGDIDGRSIHIGDTYSEEAAREIVGRLSFETGFYSRAWEISSAHLTEDANRYLMALADLATPERFLFIAFRIPYSPAIGIKLISTPWTDSHLQYTEGIAAEQLWQEFRDKGMPESMAYVLQRAGEADVRFLIFDADAPILDGLPLYEP